MKDSKKPSNISKSDIPKDPCYLCLVTSCCNEPCSLLMDYMNAVYDLVESDLTHPVLDQFPRYLQESIVDFVKKKKELENKYKKSHKKGEI